MDVEEEEDDEVEEDDVEEEDRSQDREANFVRVCAVKCTRTCQKRHFVQKITGKMPDASGTTSIEHRPLPLPVRTPSVWPHCLGN